MGAVKQRKRERPVLNICGTDFYVDAMEMQLCEVGNEANQLNAIEMLDLGGHREFLYDKELRNFYQGKWNGPYDQRAVEWVFIPSLEAVDQEGMEILRSQGYFKSMVDEQKDLPRITIAGVEFLRNDRRKEFRQADNLFNVIHFNDIVREEKDMVCYFDPKLKNVPLPNVFSPYEPLDRVPEHIVRVVIEPAYQQKENKSVCDGEGFKLKSLERKQSGRRKGRSI